LKTDLNHKIFRRCNELAVWHKADISRKIAACFIIGHSLPSFCGLLGYTQGWTTTVGKRPFDIPIIVSITHGLLRVYRVTVTSAQNNRYLG
jgi:hypothetical protein